MSYPIDTISRRWIFIFPGPESDIKILGPGSYQWVLGPGFQVKTSRWRAQDPGSHIWVPSPESTVLGSTFLVCRQLKPIFLQKEYPALVFSWKLSKLFNNNFFKEFCYKKKSIVIGNVNQISIADLIRQL